MSEIRAVAERVLFSSSLEEKLSAPPLSQVSDHQPGPAILTPASPGRPDALTFDRKDREAGLPSRHEIGGEEDRGRLLHFFANHELLATELMALVLLKFPEAPASFRRGIYQTMREEQAHTRLYQERLRACGVHFGQHRVNSFFWRCVSDMESPLDYVSRLSLTFEQANLDYSCYFGGLFAREGDRETAALFDRIYRDEIGHVRYGWTWFQRLHPPGQDPWESFRSRLQLPLSPARARGLGRFNVEGRQRAGLPTPFINEIRIFQQSRGRTSDLYLFNPEAEASIPGERDPMAAVLARDLATLPLALASRDDLLLLPSGSQAPSDWRLELSRLGIAYPEMRAHRDSQDWPAARKLHRVRPWAPAPTLPEILSPWQTHLHHPWSWQPAWGELFSKIWFHPLREEWSQSQGRPSFGRILSSKEDLQDYARELAEKGHQHLLLKPAFGLAGRGHQRLSLTGALPAIEKYPLLGEPYFDRVFDFSLQLEMRAPGLQRVGLTHLVNDAGGRYRGTLVGPKWLKGAPTEVTRWFHESRGPGAPLALFDSLLPALERALSQKAFLGPCGLDAFVYRDSQGALQLHPAVEFNPRVTMSRYALGLRGKVHPASYGAFLIVTRKRARRPLPEVLAHWQRIFPEEQSDEPERNLQQGVVPLQALRQDSACGALFLVSRDVRRLHAALTGQLTR
ncbi:MAG: DUF455 family protein [Verrucomicrobiota bacterium]